MTMTMTMKPLLLSLLVLFSRFANHVVTADGHCFNSTLAILTAQVLDTRSDSEMKVYEFCPGAVISVGVPTDASFSNFANGDWPLAVIRPNVTIEGNGATLTGGLVQFVTIPFFSSPAAPGLVFQGPFSGVTVKDLAFSGPLFEVQGFANFNLLITGPGDLMLENIVVQDVDLSDADCSRMIFVGPDALPAF